MIAPAAVKFNTDHFILGNAYHCVMAVRGYSTITEELALLSHLGERSNVTEDAGSTRSNCVPRTLRPAGLAQRNPSLCLSAEYFGVPQRRRRIFAVTDFAGFRPIQILFGQDCLPGYHLVIILWDTLGNGMFYLLPLRIAGFLSSCYHMDLRLAEAGLRDIEILRRLVDRSAVCNLNCVFHLFYRNRIYEVFSANPEHG